MSLAGGERNRRITLQGRSVTYDTHNQPIEGFAAIGSVWASWRRASAGERLSSGQVSAQFTDVFEILWSAPASALDPTGRVIFKGRPYDVIEVTEIGFREGLLIRAAAKAESAP